MVSMVPLFGLVILHWPYHKLSYPYVDSIQFYADIPACGPFSYLLSP